MTPEYSGNQTELSGITNEGKKIESEQTMQNLKPEDKDVEIRGESGLMDGIWAPSA